MKFKIKSVLSRKINNRIIVYVMSGVLYFLCCLKYFFVQFFSSKHIISDTKEFEKKEIKNDLNFKNSNLNYDLSIIIPVYNCKNLLIECLDSIFNQTTKYLFEVIVVDDGSTDGLQNSLMSISALYPIKLLTIKNSGQGFARNRGIEISSGRRLMFMDADDIMLDGAIETLMGYEEDLVQCGFKYFGARHCTIIHNDCFFDDSKRILECNCFMEGYPWGKIYARDLFLDNGFPEKVHFEDNNLSFLILPQIKSYRYVGECFIGYRIHDEQETAMVRNSSIGIDQIYVVDFLFHKSLAKFGLNRLIRDYLFEIAVYNITTILASRVHNDDDLLICFQYLLFAFLSDFSIKESKRCFKYRQLQRALMQRDFSKFRHVCKIL